MEIYLLFEILLIVSNSFITSSDNYRIIYNLTVFLLTIILAIGLKSICNHLNKHLFSPKEYSDLQ